MTSPSNSYQFISHGVFGRVVNFTNLEVYFSIMHVFGWIIIINDDVIHMCFNVTISLIIIIFENLKVLIRSG